MQFAYSQNNVEAGPDKAICKGATISTGVIIGGPNIYPPGSCFKWSPSSDLDDNTKLNPIAFPQSQTTYTLTVNGVSGSDNMTVYVPNVSIVKPLNDEKVCFGPEATGILTINCEIAITPDNPTTRSFFNNNVSFQTNQKNGSVLIWSIPGGVVAIPPISGIMSVTATFTGLPTDNSDFGNTNITMTNNACSNKTETRNIKVFYPALDNNHPGGISTDPNWYYYWSQALGVTTEHVYNAYLTSITPFGTYDPYGLTTASGCDVNSMEIGPLAFCTTPYYSTTIQTQHRYINGFQAVNLHESMHRDHLNHNFCFHGHSGYNLDKLPIEVDVDRDGICDSDSPNTAGWHDGGWELKIGTSAFSPDSPETVADYAIIHGSYQLEYKDWANPGSQW